MHGHARQFLTQCHELGMLCFCDTYDWRRADLLCICRPLLRGLHECRSGPIACWQGVMGPLYIPCYVQGDVL